MSEVGVVHRKMVPISIELWQEMMTTGWESHFRCIEGLPEGAVFVDARYNPEMMSLVLFFDHPSFPAVGSAVSRLVPTIGKLDCGRSWKEYVEGWK
jgi:hypothetical protein